MIDLIVLLVGGIVLIIFVNVRTVSVIVLIIVLIVLNCVIIPCHRFH